AWVTGDLRSPLRITALVDVRRVMRISTRLLGQTFISPRIVSFESSRTPQFRHHFPSREVVEGLGFFLSPSSLLLEARLALLDDLPCVLGGKPFANVGLHPLQLLVGAEEGGDLTG